MLRLVFTIFTLLYINLIMVIIFNKKFGRMMPISYIVVTYLMFLASLLGKISYFKYVLLCFFIISFLYLLYLFFKKDIDYKKIINLYLNPSLLVFIIFFIYLYYVLSNSWLSNIDDINFWGMKLLDINRIDTLYTTEYTPLGVDSYPPFTTLLETTFIMLFGTFNQKYAMLAMGSFSFSLFLVVFDKFEYKIKDLVNVVLTLLIVICTTLMIQNNYYCGANAFIYNSLYVDWLLGLLMTKCFYSIYILDKEKIEDYIELGLYSSAMLLCKQIGAALFLLIIVSTYVYLATKEKRIFILKNTFLNFLITLVIPLVFYCIWKIQVGKYITFSVSEGVVNGLTETISSPTDGFKEYFNKFIYAYFNYGIIYKPFEISYFWITVIVTLLLIVIGYIRGKKKDYYVIPLFYFLGSLGYALGMLISYMYLFSDGITLPVYGRYMQTYTFGGIALLILIVLSKNHKYWKYIIICIVCMIFVETKSINTLIYDKDREIYYSKQSEPIKEYFEYIYNYEPMVVFAQTDIRNQAMIRYLADEKYVNIKNAQLIEGESYEYFLSLLKGKELLYIGDYNDVFLKYWKMLTDVEPYNRSLYKINQNNGETLVQLLYTWDDIQ